MGVKIFDFTYLYARRPPFFVVEPRPDALSHHPLGGHFSPIVVDHRSSARGRPRTRRLMRTMPSATTSASVSRATTSTRARRVRIHEKAQGAPKGRRRGNASRERRVVLALGADGERDELASSASASGDDLVARLRRGESSSSRDGDAGAAAARRAEHKANREKDAVTKAMLALALGVASMMPTITTEAPAPSPVVTGAKRTVVAGTMKSATSDANRTRDASAAEDAFVRDVERFVGRVNM